MRKYRSIGVNERTELIYSLGLQNDYNNSVIESKEETAIKKVTELCEFVVANNRPPKLIKNTPEYNLCAFFHSIRTLISTPNKTRRIPYQCYNDIPNKYGVPNLFTTYLDEYNKTQRRLDIIQLCEWIVLNKRIPLYKRETNPDNIKMANICSHVRKQYRNNTLEVDTLDIINSYNITDLLAIPKVNTLYDNTLTLMQWIKQNSRMPTTVSKNKVEVYTGHILNKIRQLKKKQLLPVECENIIKENDLMECLDLNIKSNKEQITRCNEYTRNKMHILCKWIIDNNRAPSASRQCDLNERTAYMFMSRINNFLTKKKIRKHNFPPDIMEIPLQYKCQQFFKYM
jgi:hypothetical protein